MHSSSIFRLTRVTRIFQKEIFTETTLGARAACRAGFFVARAARAAARGGFLVLAEKTGKYRGDQSHAVSKGPKRKSGRTAARDRQSGNCARAESIVGTRRGDRAQGDRTRRRGRYGGIRVCMERLVPPIKHQPVAVELPPLEKAADSVEALASIAAAVAAGDLTAAEAAELAKVVEVYVGALASRAFEERLSALEKGVHRTPDVGTPDVPGPAAVPDDTGSEACTHAAGQDNRW